MTIRFVLTGPPRTKKNSPIPTPAKTRDGRPFVRVLPSAAYRQWFQCAMQQGPGIRLALARAGVELPIRGLVNMAAVIYREVATGDLLGYLDGLADALQQPKLKVDGKARQIVADAKGRPRLSRNGIAVIVDDRQIVSLDGSRLAKDAACPRIEVELTVVQEQPEPGELFPVEEEEEDF